MGDRSLTIFTDSNKSAYSPTVYLHWAGNQTPNFIMQTKKHMVGRLGDIQYACARFIGFCHADSPDSNLSLGVWNTKPADVKLIEDENKEFSHGDAGVFVVNVTDFSVKHFGGYPPEWPKED